MFISCTCKNKDRINDLGDKDYFLRPFSSFMNAWQTYKVIFFLLFTELYPFADVS